MPRSEQPLGPGDNPVTAFARDLRKLRAATNSSPYRELARRAHYSATTLADAAGGKKLPSLAATLAYVRACEGDPVEWEQRWHAVAAELAVRSKPADPAPENDPAAGNHQAPYAGLAAFQPDDADRFFGREALVDQVVRRVAAQRFLAVFGASGAGKSSLLRAGLIATIQPAGTGTNGQRPVVLMTPGRCPLEECAVQLAALTSESAVAVYAELLADANNLHLRVRQALAERVKDVDLLLVVDQFEEVFTLYQDPHERDQFLAALLHAAQSPTSRTRVVLGVRTDFYTHCAAHPELAEALQDAQVLVGPMSSEQLRSAITRPALESGYRLESALVAAIMAETAGQPGVLPLVSHALLETWRRRRGTTLTLAGYQAAGGIAHAIARTAENVYEELDEAQQTLAQDLFLRLTALGEGTEDTKRRVYHRELDASPDTTLVLERLTQARLITADRDNLEITHEALIRCWPRLRDWLSADREGLRIHRQLIECTDTWESLNRDSAALYRGIRLDQASEWASAGRAALTARERQFLEASERARDDEQAQTLRRTRRLRQLIAAVVVFALLAVTAAVVAIQQRNDAVFRQVVAEADRQQDSDPSLSAQLALMAHRMRPADQDVDTRLLATQNAPLAMPLTGHTGNVYLTSFRRDGHILATACEDSTVRLWDVRDPNRPAPLGQPLTGHDGWVSSAVFSPDGHTLATAGDDGTIQLWNVTDPARPARLGTPLTTHNGSIYSIAFSPDGRTLATASENHTVRLWNVTDPAHARSLDEPLTGHTGQVRTVAFSPDGHTLAAGGDDTTILLWNVTDPARPVRLGRRLAGHTSIVHSVAFSPDGRVLATGSRDGTVRLWNAADGALLGFPLTAHTDAIWSVAFSPDGHVLATGSADGTARLWNVSDPTNAVQLGPRLATGGDLYAVGFSPDGHTLATGSSDGVVRLWSLPTAVLIGHRTDVNSTAFNPNGHLMATGAHDGTVRLWNMADPTHPTPLGHIPAVPGYIPSCGARCTVVRFSPDSRILAVLSYAKIVQLWSIDDPEHPTLLAPTLTLSTRYSTPLSFSPDGHTLATGYDDDTSQLWDVTDPTRPTSVARLTGHHRRVSSVAFSLDGRLLATAIGDLVVGLWDVTDRTSPKARGQLTGTTPIAFGPDGRTLASAGADQTVRLWNIADPTHPVALGNALTGHTKSVSSVAFSPDGSVLASASTDHTIRLWNITDPTDLSPRGQPMTTFAGAGYAMAFSPDGHFLAAADGAKTVRLLDLNVDHAVQRICATTPGLLPRRQWEVHLPALPHQPPCHR